MKVNFPLFFPPYQKVSGTWQTFDDKMLQISNPPPLSGIGTGNTPNYDLCVESDGCSCCFSCFKICFFGLISFILVACQCWWAGGKRYTTVRFHRWETGCHIFWRVQAFPSWCTDSVNVSTVCNSRSTFRSWKLINSWNMLTYCYNCIAGLWRDWS